MGNKENKLTFTTLLFLKTTYEAGAIKRKCCLERWSKILQCQMQGGGKGAAFGVGGGGWAGLPCWPRYLVRLGAPGAGHHNFSSCTEGLGSPPWIGRSAGRCSQSQSLPRCCSLAWRVALCRGGAKEKPWISWRLVIATPPPQTHTQTKYCLDCLQAEKCGDHS